ncbi:hypothetical protein [Pantoea agglomerans]|uniref:hypothetical protein n=1 Tax=Enterobacter agglomerans TaxID=549 RepID=UPI001F5B898A|nr:hypothetical protein [Pantoea agglomerans]
MDSNTSPQSDGQPAFASEDQLSTPPVPLAPPPNISLPAAGTPSVSAYLAERQIRMSSFKPGALDLAGNKIEKIYSVGDEYFIYEASNLPPHESMLVFIDTIEEFDKTLISRYHSAKEHFDEFISSFHKYNCSSIYKKRAATVLSAILQGITTADESSFKKIINDIEKEYKDTTTGRSLYQVGAISLSILLIFLALLTYVTRDSTFIKENHFIPLVLYAASFASMGGFISVSLKIKTLHTERELSKKTYFFHGAERILFSIIAGVLVFFMFKGNLIFGFLNSGDSYSFSIYIVCALSGFSETLIPNTLRNLETKSEL